MYPNEAIYPFKTFEDASRAVLNQLHKTYGFGLWMMTKTVENDWIVLQAEDHGYDVKDGTVFKWSDSFCSRMVKGEGPRIAPNSNQVQAYLEAPIGQQVEINAYIGVPVFNKDGSLFGTLCAIDPEPKDEEIESALPQIELYASLLSTILAHEIEKERSK